MYILDTLENILILFITIISLFTICTIGFILIIMIYIVYFLLYNKIKNYDVQLKDILYEIIDEFKFEKKWIEIDNKKVLIIESNSNKKSIPLFFVHGTYSSSVAFFDLISKIPKEYHCITVELPNFGISDDLNYDIKKDSLQKICNMYCQFLEKVLDKLKIKKVNLIGHSLGAIICLYLANKKPNLINELFLLSIPGIYKTSGKYGFFNGILFKYLLPPKLLKFNFLKNLEKPLMYYYRNSNIFIRYWILYSFKTGTGNEIIGRFIKLGLSGGWSNPFITKILRLKCKTNIWIGGDDFLIDSYDNIFQKIAPHISLKKFDNVCHNVYTKYDDFITELINKVEKKCVYKIGKVKNRLLEKLIRFLKKGRSFPSIRQTTKIIDHNRKKLENILKNKNEKK